MSAKTNAALTAETTSIVTGQTNPETITPTTLGGLLKDLVDSMWNKTDNTVVSQLTNDAGYLTTIGGINAGGDLSGNYPNPGVAKIKGNAIPVDAAGTLRNDGAGNLTWRADGTKYQASGLNPAAMTGNAFLMMGLAGAITPAKTGTFMIIVNGEYVSDDAASNTVFKIYTGTGAVPNNGDSTSGIAQITNNRKSFDGASRIPFSFSVVVSGLTIATPYWIDVAMKNLANGVVQIFNVSLSAIEL